MAFFLVHNAETIGVSDSFDEPLTAAGRVQAQQLESLLRTLGVKNLYTAPSIRALDTAAPFVLAQRKRGDALQKQVAYDLYSSVLTPHQKPRWLSDRELAARGFSVQHIDGTPPPPEDDESFCHRIAAFYDNIIFQRLQQSPVPTAVVCDGPTLAVLADHIARHNPRLRPIWANAEPSAVFKFKPDGFRAAYDRQIR